MSIRSKVHTTTS